jgi:hypothetical protein
MPKRVAAIDVSHWHSAFDAAYLRILRDLGCEIVGVSDRSGRISKNRAERFGSTPFTDHRRMIETWEPAKTRQGRCRPGSYLTGDRQLESSSLHGRVGRTSNRSFT